MAVWPFGRKNKNAEEPEAPAEETQLGVGAAYESSDVDLDDDADQDPDHDAVGGDTGPFDGRSVDFNSFDFSDFGTGVLNLGSVVIPLPHGSEVQVEMGPEGPKMLHILTPYGRVTPVAFAAPASKGQWREATKDIAASMRNDGLDVEVQHGPWGREVVGSMQDGGGVVRIIGVDGPRWMLRMTVACPKESTEEMTALAREITARTFVYRNDDPILAGTSLPVALPQPLAEQVQAEMQRRQQAAQAASPQATIQPAKETE
ncbi:DUF3710 domain-containing protein [Corynebacterium vitaeruminis]|uniref:DUF3710 domain-containing protein n=1 Tax=Corynebacterium vitaeruminis DSM 20294 TaxID=1224164 RepID=W5Y152_9CORY|nr:DUF3710 domain-containing protein [Corynebacterium vitaeruminis]AHI22961.1 hypothetical protein B843_07880 [Corynebacterium vitaeruminis DSM 20294]